MLHPFSLFALLYITGLVLQLTALAIYVFNWHNVRTNRQGVCSRTKRINVCLFTSGTLFLIGAAALDQDATLFVGEALLLGLMLYGLWRQP